MPSALRVSRFVALLSLALPLSLAAQSAGPLTETGVASHLMDRTVFLRGFWADNTLDFDSEGHLAGTPRQDSFTTCAMHVTKVKLQGAALHVDGDRYGLEWKKGTLSEVRLKKHREMHLTIAVPADGDYRRAIDAVFADDLEHLIPSLPEMWQDFAAAHFHPGRETAGQDKPVPREGVVEIKRNPDGTTEPVAPKLIHQVDPEFSGAARDMMYTGESLVAMEVNRQGQVEHVRIVTPVGLGLDEEAVAAVRQYVFEPARKNGEPVAVMMQVAVNFRIFRSPFHF